MSGTAVANPAMPGGFERRVTVSAPMTSGSTVAKHPSMDRPPTRGRVATPKTPSGDRLTPMPDYMRPITRSAVRKWKKLHEDHMMEKLVQKRNEKKMLNQKTRQEARKIARKIPMEVLAKEWLSDNRATDETRAFLVDKILPTLILGVEKMLIEADRRDLAESNEPDPYFNPVNYLAQYLMRNNPKYSNFSEASPYVRGLREIGEELKKQLFDIEENKLARIKAEARQKREERERAEQMKIMEKQRREDLLKKQYWEWNAGVHPEGRVELALIQNALRSFAEIAEQLPEDLRESVKFGQKLEPTDDTGKTLGQQEFVQYLTQYVEEVPSEVFDHFIIHLSQCATSYKGQTEREERRITLTQLFVTCDHTGTGLLDRHRVLNLFEMFYDKIPETLRATLRNPRKWPVVDVHEEDITISDSEDEEQDPKFFDNNKDVTQETKAAEKLKEGGEETKMETVAGDNQQQEEDSKEQMATDEDPELAMLVDKEDAALPVTATERPPMTQQSKVSFAEGTTFEREKTNLASHGSRSQSQASAFDENLLNLPQFVQINETFLGDAPVKAAFNQLVQYIREGYMETEDERMQRLVKARKEALSAKRKALINSLFEMWDNDGSGYLDLDEVEEIMKKYKEGLENQAISDAKDDFKKKARHHDNRLTKREFRDFVYKVVENMAGSNDFDYFIEFLLSSVERSYAERVRGEARKKWLQQIINAGDTSGVALEPVYKQVFQALYKDSEAHGAGKVISAYIAMLERNEVLPSRGDFLLRYVAATPDAAQYVLGKALFKDMRGISFASVDSGKPIHVPRVGNHGNIHFWNPDRADEVKEGSFIVVPLKDQKKRVFGLLGIDTLNDPHSRAIFITHEIQFFQGIAKAFSISYHHVDVRRKTMRISESAVSWIHRRSPHVHEIVVYMVEPDGKGQDYILRKMMTTDEKGHPTILRKPPRLERRDNLFRDYLFKCADNSESVTADAYGERHLAIPLRDDDGMAIVVIDISIGSLKQLPRNEGREVMKMLRLLQMAYREIVREGKEDSESSVEDTKAEILFDRLMLLELRENVAKLDSKAYAELKSYNEPPNVIHKIIQSVLGIFYPDKAREGEFDSWSQCKQYVTPQLSQSILAYDPTEDESNFNIPVDLIHGYLEDVPHGQVNKHGSIPAQYLYNWVFVCVSLIDHSHKMSEDRQKTLKEQKNLVGDERELTGIQSKPPESQAPQAEEAVAEETSDKTDAAAAEGGNQESEASVDGGQPSEETTVTTEDGKGSDSQEGQTQESTSEN